MNYLEIATRHLTAFFVGHAAKKETWRHGPMAAVKDFFVMRYAPGPRSDLWIYSSVGASLPDADPQRLEFFALSPRADARIVELVTMIAHYHRTEKLDLFHILSIGEPWLDDGSCDSFLISLPYTFGPTLERLESDDFSARFLWLLPITSAERLFAKTHGVEALEERFDDSKLQYWDIQRHSVV